MKNIALIINSLQGGGAERCAADLSLFFNKNGYCVYIITDLSAGVKYEYSGKLINYIFPFSRSGKNSLVEKVNELKKIKRKYHIDIAISFMPVANYVNILSKEEDKIILTTHALNSECAKYERNVYWSEQTFKELYQFADVITFPSDYCRNDWLKHYGDFNNITKTVYNPVHFMHVNDNIDKKNIIITVGRMHGIKRQWHIVRVFKLVKEKCPDCKLIILGDGDLRFQIESLIIELGLENDVELPGNVQNVQDYLAQAKVFTMTSRCEAMPCAVLEALSAGVPVVACDIPGGIKEEIGIEDNFNQNNYPIRGTCGIITPYIKENLEEDFSDEEKSLADEIVYLLQNEQLRSSMGRNASKNIEKFTIEKIGSIWINDIFSKCLNREIDKERFADIREKNFLELKKSDSINENMYVAYYRLLEKWMTLRDKGKNIGISLCNKKMKNIIIYGYGKIANHLITELKDSNINIVCAIDKSAIDMYGEFPVITIEDNIPEADCIIVTPIYQYEDIKAQLSEKTSIPVISLGEIIDYVR